MPYGKDLYPVLFVLRCLITIYLEILVASPLLADYVHLSSKGLAGGYVQMAMGLAATVFSFGFLQMAQSLPLTSISIAVTICCGLAALYNAIFSKNIYQRRP